MAEKKTAAKTARSKPVNALFAVSTPTSAPTPDAGEIEKGDIITWGPRNDFPQEITRLYDRNPTLQSIIEGTSDFIAGNGLSEIAPEITEFSKKVNDDGDDLFDIVDRIGQHSELYGGAFIKITRTLDKQNVAGLSILDPRRCRCLANNAGIKLLDVKNGKILNAGINYQFFSGWDSIDEDTEHEQVYFWRGRRPRGYYPRPRYASALQAADTQTRIQEYYSSLVQNNFTLGGILSIPADGMGEEQMTELVKRINATYQGAGNAGRLLVQFFSSQTLESKYTPISANDLDKQYIEVKKSTREDVYAAFRAIPALFGIMTETTGFSQQEFQDAFDLYSTTVVNPRQRDIIRIFSEIFGIENPFKIIPFDFKGSGGGVPSDMLKDLTANERRALVGYEPLKGDDDANTQLLAEKLGVGGTQSLIAIVSDPTMAPEAKVNMLITLFSFSQEQAKKLIPNAN